MPQQRVKLIVNPNADRGRAWRTVSALRPIVEEYVQADWCGTVYPGHATQLARQAGEEGCDLVIAVGGDGTAHEVMNGLMQVPAERRPRMGSLPLGSGNDFAYACGMSHNPIEAARQIFTGKPRKIDIGLMRDDQGRTIFFDNTLGIGFDAITTIRSRRLTTLRGFFIYLVAVLQTIVFDHHAPKMKITTDQESWEESNHLICLCNGGREGGGFLIYPEARIDDGILNYTEMRLMSRLMMLRILPEVMKGTHSKFKQIRMGQFKRLKLVSDAPVAIHLDGEIYAGFDSTLRSMEVEIIPEALTVVS